MSTITKSGGMQDTLNCSCIRCNGFLVVEEIYFLDGLLGGEVRQIRCVNCGWVCFEQKKEVKRREYNHVRYTHDKSVRV